MFFYRGVPALRGSECDTMRDGYGLDEQRLTEMST